jgi:hypothetical protein
VRYIVLSLFSKFQPSRCRNEEKKSNRRTDGRTDGKTDDSTKSIGHIFLKMCSNKFFEEFICGRWYIYLEQTIYHLCRPISCWLSSLAIEYHLLWTIISYVAWYSSPADDIQLKQMILIWRGWYSSRADDIHPMATIFIQERRISSMMVDSWNYHQPLGMIINHLGW